MPSTMEDYILRKSVSAPDLQPEEEGEPIFDTTEEAAEHYKTKYKELLEALNETRQELDDFQQSSKELEDELERELESTEREKKELSGRIDGLVGEVEGWKDKHAALQKLYNSSSESMQREIDNLRSERDKAKEAVITLEQGNDDLERNQRNAMSSLLDLESRHNRLIEEKILLEEELVNKSELQVEVQRLKDELRDQAEEMEMLKLQTLNTAPNTPPAVLVLERPDFMSPVLERSYEGSPAFGPAFSTHRPQVSERMTESPASHGTPLPAAALARRRLDLTGRTATPPSGLSRSNTISQFPSSPSPPSHVGRIVPASKLPSSLSRSVTSKNIHALAGHSPSGLPVGIRPPSTVASPSPPARNGRDNPLASSTYSTRSTVRGRLPSDAKPSRALSALKLAADTRGRMASLKARLTTIDANKRKSTQPLPTASTVPGTPRGSPRQSPGTGARTLPSSAAKRHSVMVDGRSLAVPHARVMALMGEDRGIKSPVGAEEQSGYESSPNSWVVVDGGAPGNYPDGAPSPPEKPKGMDEWTTTQNGDGGGLSATAGFNKALPARSGISSSLVTAQQASLGKSTGNVMSRFVGRSISRISSTTTTATSSSASEDNRPETPLPSHSFAIPEGTEVANGSRPSSGVGSRPSSSLGHRPESRLKMRPTSTAARPPSATGHRPSSSLSVRSRAGEAFTRQRIAGPPAVSQRPTHPGLSKSTSISRLPFPAASINSASSSRPSSGQGSAAGMVSPVKASGSRLPVAGYTLSPSKPSTQRIEDDAPASGMRRSSRRISLNGSTTTSGIPRRSLSGRPPSIDFINQPHDAPPVPPMSPEYKSAAFRRTNPIGMGLPGPLKER